MSMDKNLHQNEDQNMRFITTTKLIKKQNQFNFILSLI